MPPCRDAYLNHASYYASRFDEIETLILSGGSYIEQALHMFEQDYPNIKLGLLRASNYAQLNHKAAHICLNYGKQLNARLLNLYFAPTQRIVWLEPIIHIAKEINKLIEITALGHTARAYTDLCEYDKALVILEYTIAEAQMLSDLHLESRQLGHLSYTLTNCGKIEESIQNAEKSVSIAQQCNDLHNMSQQLNNLGRAYAYFGKHSQALDCLDQALDIACELNDLQMERVILNNIGNLHSVFGNTELSITSLERSLAIARLLGDKRAEQHSLGGLGDTYKDMGENLKAIEYLKQALTIANEIGSLRNEGIWLRKLGICLHDLDHMEEALSHFHRALEIAEEANDVISQCNLMGTIGKWYLDYASDLKKVGYYFYKEYEIAQKLGSQEMIATALTNQGDMFFAKCAYDQAVEFYYQAYNINLELNYLLRTGENMGKMGVAYIKLGQSQKAVQYLNKAIHICQKADNQFWAEKFSCHLESIES